MPIALSSFAATIVLLAASIGRAERVEDTCQSHVLMFDSEMPHDVVWDPRGEVCIFAVYLPQAAFYDPGTMSAATFKEAFQADGEARAGFLAKAETDFLKSAERLLSDKRLMDRGGPELLKRLAVSYKAVQLCTNEAYAGKPFDAEITTGLKLTCRLDEGRRNYEIWAASEDVTLKIHIPLA